MTGTTSTYTKRSAGVCAIFLMLILICIIHNAGFIHAVILIAWIYGQSGNVDREYEIAGFHYSNLNQNVFKPCGNE